MDSYSENQIFEILERIQDYATVYPENAQLACGRIWGECEAFLRPIRERKEADKKIAEARETERAEAKEQESGRGRVRDRIY